MSRLVRLWDNYESSVDVSEDRTDEEREEEDDFLNEVTLMPVMIEAFNFLRTKGTRKDECQNWVTPLPTNNITPRDCPNVPTLLYGRYCSGRPG